MDGVSRNEPVPEPAPVLGLRTRRIVSLAAAAAKGLPEVFKSRLAEALTADPGILPEIREVVFQLVPYCGWAVTLNAVTVLRREMEERRLSFPAATPPLDGLGREELRSLGLATARRVNPQFDRVAAELAAFDPDLVDLLTESAYGYVYNRPGLGLLTRELVAVAVLHVLKQDRQLRYHKTGAMNVGATPEMVEETIRESDRWTAPGKVIDS